MKKILLFIVSFAAAYIIIGYFPSMRIKLAAEPMAYFIATIKHNVEFKLLVSSVCGLLVLFLPLAFSKRTK